MTEDYRVAKMPPVNTGLLDGELAWRQHDGGHEERSNMSFFIAWANRLLHHTPPPVPADQPRVRADRNSHVAHQQLLAKAKSGDIDLYFLGDSITRRWGATDYPDFLAHWDETFHGWNAGNFGWGGDRTENILWRLSNGELDGVNPKVIVLLAGTNNVGKEPGDEVTVAAVTRGLQAIVDACRKKAPAATIVITAIFPRNDNPAVMPTIARINVHLAKMADGKSLRFLDVNARLADPKGTLFEGMRVDGLHPGLKGYEVWAEGLKPVLTELVGPPAATTTRLHERATRARASAQAPSRLRAAIWLCPRLDQGCFAGGADRPPWRSQGAFRALVRDATTSKNPFRDGDLARSRRESAMKDAHRLAAVTLFAAAVALVPFLAVAVDAPDVTGTWAMTVETAMGSGQPTFTLTQKGEDVTGHYKGRFGEAPVTGTIKGTQVTLSFTISVEGQEIRTEYAGTVDGDTMAGKVVFGSYGEGTFKGTRARPPQS